MVTLLASSTSMDSSGVLATSFSVSPSPVEKLKGEARAHFSFANCVHLRGDTSQRLRRATLRTKPRGTTGGGQQLSKAVPANGKHLSGKISKTRHDVAIVSQHASSGKFETVLVQPKSNSDSNGSISGTVSLGIRDRTSTADADQEERPTAEASSSHPYADLQIGERWRNIQGENDWAGLLDPMDRVLAGEIMRYGDFAQATYDAFDQNSFSKYCGSCTYRKKDLFRMLALDDRGYEVTNNIYCTADIQVPSFFRKPEEIPDEEKWSQDSNWMGFVAVCTSKKEIARMGRRDIVVAWRGTVTELEWIADLQSCQDTDPRMVKKGWPADLKVERGFLSMYLSEKSGSKFNKTSASKQVVHAVAKLLETYKDEEKLSITLTGHSMGGALAVLCGYELAESKVNIIRQVSGHHRAPRGGNAASTSSGGRAAELLLRSSTNGNGRLSGTNHSARTKEDAAAGSGVDRVVPVTVYSFASPRLGNVAFRHRLEKLGVKVLRVVNRLDLVPLVPGLILNEKTKFLTFHISKLSFFSFLKPALDFLDSLVALYVHVGVQLQIDVLQSPFLKQKGDPLTAHNLEGYLHLLDGFQGASKGASDPHLYGRRDLALVNKCTDLLKAEYRVPPSWFQEHNKGLVKTDNGKLVMHGREPGDVPETEELS